MLKVRRIHLHENIDMVLSELLLVGLFGEVGDFFRSQFKYFFGVGQLDGRNPVGLKRANEFIAISLDGRVLENNDGGVVDGN